nr:protein mono-ADP-ribosyltransferase PARP12-like isoform X3 [Cherax quadricarinatus]XP_053657483.1 protein mono-ADP-ribosyltransferase PARP12-like isoform X3 [Cherax quadricarinatus]
MYQGSRNPQQKGSNIQEYGNSRQGQNNDELHRRHWQGSREVSQHQMEYEDPLSYNSCKTIQVTPQTLVECLANFRTFSASLIKLMEDRHLQPSSVREIVSAWPKIFNLNGEIAELKPQVKICTAHCGTQGCQKHSSCDDLHICSSYVLNWCYEKNCVLGHKWMTDHNTSVLQSFFLDRLPFRTLHRLIQSMTNTGDIGQLEICHRYNEGGCNQSNCGALHMCLSFVVGLTRCSYRDCQLNHNLLNHDCYQLLKTYGLPTNESPRDILVALITHNPNLSQSQMPEKFTKKVPTKTKKYTGKSQKKSRKNAIDASKREVHRRKKSSCSESESSSKTEDESDSDNDSKSNTILSNDNDLEKSGNKRKSQKSNTDTPSQKVSESSRQANPADLAEIPLKQENPRTLWSHYLQGDVSVPEICYYSVEEMCKYEESGCQRLHSTQHFHWQVNDQGNRWLNLRQDQVTCLEQSYCNPSHDGIDLVRLDPATLNISVRGLLILMGRDVWHADFKAMNLTNSSKTRTLPIRRLCTEAVSGHVIKPANFIWYFLDANNKWVKYGNVDTEGKKHLISSLTTDDIEKHFKQNTTGNLPFRNSKFIYCLDFNTMTQTNLNTNVRRAVRRRPEPHLPVEKAEKGEGRKTLVDLPSYWEVMQPEERVRLVTLAPSSSEYLAVVGLLARKVQSSSVMKVQRIQNPFLWQALQNKIKELIAVYGVESKVNIRQLFHGTGHKVVPSICAENFDWRLHGSSSGQSFGQGTYFSSDAAYSYRYCRPDDSGMKYMFIARTAVGSIVCGNSSMVRPPTNPATNRPFDSTVNNVVNPTIIVKYDKQEYYPEYILTLT